MAGNRKDIKYVSQIHCFLSLKLMLFVHISTRLCVKVVTDIVVFAEFVLDSCVLLSKCGLLVMS